MFWAIFSPIIRSTWLYLQYLVVFTEVPAGWCLGWVQTQFYLIQDMFRGNIFAHHQEHLTLFTVSGSTHPGSCWLVSWMSWNCFIPSKTCFGAIFSPIIRGTWLYLEYLVVFTQVAAGWCHGWVVTHPRHHLAATWVNTTRYYAYSQVLQTGGNIAPKHAELTRNDKISCIVTSCWLLS
jgi:hypothetical protein